MCPAAMLTCVMNLVAKQTILALWSRSCMWVWLPPAWQSFFVSSCFMIDMSAVSYGLTCLLCAVEANQCWHCSSQQSPCALPWRTHIRYSVSDTKVIWAHNYLLARIRSTTVCCSCDPSMYTHAGCVAHECKIRNIKRHIISGRDLCPTVTGPSFTCTPSCSMDCTSLHFWS